MIRVNEKKSVQDDDAFPRQHDLIPVTYKPLIIKRFVFRFLKTALLVLYPMVQEALRTLCQSETAMELKKQSSENVTAMKVKSLHLPFSWPSKPGTPIATPGIFLVMSCLHQSEVNRMSFEKKEKRCYQRLRK